MKDMKVKMSWTCVCGEPLYTDSGMTMSGMKVKPTSMYKKNGKDVEYRGQNTNLICLNKDCGRKTEVFFGWVVTEDE